MRIDLSSTPYSRAGSHLVVDLDKLDTSPELRIGTRFKGGLAHSLFAMPLGQGQVEGAPGGLQYQAPSGSLRLNFPDAWHMRLSWFGSIVLHTHFTAPNVVQLAEREWLLFGWKQGLILRLHLGGGAIRLGPDSKVPDCREPANLLLEATDRQGDLLIAYGVREPFPDLALLEESVESQSRRIDAEFASFLDAFPDATDAMIPSREDAAYILWSTLRAPLGHITRTASVMSNHWMNNIWNWDNFFNALALAPGHPHLAAEAFSLLFDHISPEGQLPDYLNQAEVSYMRTKPPVHGRFLILMLEAGFDPGENWLADIYEKMARQATWWLEKRTLGPGQSPAYFFPSESGWDNATCLKGYCPAISPDLAAIFMSDLDALGTLASRLGKPNAASKWREQQDSIRAFLESKLIANGRPRVLDLGLRPIRTAGQSLLPFVALYAGNLIDSRLWDALLDSLRSAPFDSPAGLATEALHSPRFVEDGYWAGAAWAPPVLLIADGALRRGNIPFAKHLAGSFCANASRNGFSENYAAASGSPLRDPQYSWSAAAFLHFLHRFPRISP